MAVTRLPAATNGSMPVRVLSLTICLAACGDGGDGSVDRLDQLGDNLGIPEVDSQSLTTKEGTAVSGTVTGHDPDGNPLRYYLSTPPSHGTVSGLPPGPVPGQEGSLSGNFVYTPAPGYVGSDVFGFVGNDGDWNSSQGRVGIRVTPQGLALSSSAKPSSAGGTVSLPGAYLTVIHEMPRQGTRLYALDRNAAAPPLVVAERGRNNRITEAGWFEGQNAVYFRSDGALFLWRPDAATSPVVVSPTSPGESQLGEIRVSPDGGYLGFVTSRRGQNKGRVFLLDSASGFGRRIEVEGPTGAAGWPQALRFEPGDAAMLFNLSDGDEESLCRVALDTTRRGGGSSVPFAQCDGS